MKGSIMHYFETLLEVIEFIEKKNPDAVFKDCNLTLDPYNYNFYSYKDLYILAELDNEIKDDIDSEEDIVYFVFTNNKLGYINKDNDINWLFYII